MIGSQKKEPPASKAEGSEKRVISLIDNTDYNHQEVNSQYNPQAVQLARQYLQENAEIRGEVQRLILHPDEIPEKDPGGDSWQPLTMADFYTPREPVKYILGGIFREKSLNILYGSPGDLKSMLLQDLAVCVSMGKPWLAVAPWQSGGCPIPTTQSPVVWLDQDQGIDEVFTRFAALGRQHNAPASSPLKVYTFQDPPFDASDPASVAMLAARVAGAGLVIIDNLGTVSGGIEENASSMRLVMSNLRWLAEFSGAAVVLIHHQRKSNGVSGRAGDALRGHSSIEASLDLALQVDREPYSDQITVKSTKARSREVAPFTAYFAYTTNGAGDLETAQFYSIEPEDDTSNYAIEREILAALEGSPMAITALWQAVKTALPDVGRPRILDQVRKLEDDHRLIMTPGVKNAKVYSLPVRTVRSSSQQFAGMNCEQEPKP